MRKGGMSMSPIQIRHRRTQTFSALAKPSQTKTACTRSRRLSPGRTQFRERSEEHTSELQSLAYLVCRLLLEKKKKRRKRKNRLENNTLCTQYPRHLTG